MVIRKASAQLQQGFERQTPEAIQKPKDKRPRRFKSRKANTRGDSKAERQTPEATHKLKNKRPRRSKSRKTKARGDPKAERQTPEAIQKPKTNSRGDPQAERQTPEAIQKPNDKRPRRSTSRSQILYPGVLRIGVLWMKSGRFRLFLAFFFYFFKRK